MITKLDGYLRARKLNDAKLLLESHLSKAEIIDPSDDKSWAQYADQISREFKSNVDRNAFWEGLLHYFETVLELKWGHLHKGHIFFRLGLTKMSEDVTSAKICLEKALEEDRVLESKKGTVDIEKAVTRYSSYVMLCLIERIEDSHFDSDTEKQKFFEELISPSFNAAIFRQEIDPKVIQASIERIVPEQSLKQAVDLKQELDAVSRLQMRTATISLAGSFLESVLLGILYSKHGHTKGASGKDIRELHLGDLYNEAIGKGVFPSDSIKASCKIIHVFRNRLHPGNELRMKYKLTERVAVTVRNLLDSALLDWSKSLQGNTDILHSEVN